MLIRTTLAALGAAILLPAQDPRNDVNPSYVFSIRGPITPAQTESLLREFDLMSCEPQIGPTPVQIVVQPYQLEYFLSLGLHPTFVERGRPYAEIEGDAPDPGYFTTAEVIADIDAQVAKNPAIAMKVDLATIPGAVKTHNGQSIWALKISDNVAVDEDEPAILVASQHHARELNSTFMTIGAMRRVMDTYATDPTIAAAVNGFELYFVPCVNPDGTDWVWCCDNLWRKNRRNNGSSFGVDLNRNYPFLWSSSCQGSTSPSSDTYRGPSAASEPETQTMRALVATLRPEVYVDFHSYGQDVLFLYAPCASVNATMRTFANNYVADLQAQTGFSTRAPSASGEAPHDHWGNSGTLSYLLEIGTNFQPVFTQTVTEEARVWPAVKRVFSTWRPAVRGHVRSIFQNQPIAASITYTPNLFNHSEKILGRARDGRYAVWLPINQTYTLTFAAAGYQNATKQVTITGYNNPITIDVEMVPTGITAATMAVSGTHQLGTTSTLTYTSPSDTGAAYWVALSGASSPAIPIGTRSLPLAFDGLMQASMMPGFPINNLGVVPGSGIVNASLPIPVIPALSGLQIFTAGITIDAQYNYNVKNFSPAASLTIQ